MYTHDTCSSTFDNQPRDLWHFASVSVLSPMHCISHLRGCRHSRRCHCCRRCCCCCCCDKSSPLPTDRQFTEIIIGRDVSVRLHAINVSECMSAVVYFRNVDPPIWYDTDVKLFEIQRVQWTRFWSNHVDLLTDYWLLISWACDWQVARNAECLSSGIVRWWPVCVCVCVCVCV